MNPGVRVSAGKAARTDSMGNLKFDPDGTSESRTSWDLACKPLLLGTSEKSALKSYGMNSAQPIPRCKYPSRTHFPPLQARISSSSFPKVKGALILSAAARVPRGDDIKTKTNVCQYP